jgi:hypothetical protein
MSDLTRGRLQAQVDKLRALLWITSGAINNVVRSIIIWDPSQPPSPDGIRLQTWEDSLSGVPGVFSAIKKAQGAIRVLVRPQSATVVTGNLGNFDVMGAEFGVWGEFPGDATISIQDGSSIENISRAVGPLVFDCQTNSGPNLTWNFGSNLVQEFILAYGAQVKSNGNAPAIVIPPNAATLTVICSDSAGFFASGGASGLVPTISIEGSGGNPGIFNLFALSGPEFNSMPALPIVGSAAPGDGQFNLTYDSTLAPTVGSWPGALFTGTFTATALEDALNMAYTAAVLANWSGTNPSSVSNALDRIAAKITPIP